VGKAPDPDKLPTTLLVLDRTPDETLIPGAADVDVGVGVVADSVLVIVLVVDEA